MWREVITTALDLIAVALIVTGVAFIFWPAALIVGGAGLAAVSWGVARGASTTETEAPE